MCLAVGDGKCSIVRLVCAVHRLQEAVLEVPRLKGHGLKIGLWEDEFQLVPGTLSDLG